MSDDRNTFLGTVFTFLTGAAIGAGLALLFAPQTGEETRKQLKETADKLSDEFKENYEKLSKEAQIAIDKIKETTEKTIDQVKNIVETTKEGIKKEEPKKTSKTTKSSTNKSK